MQVWNVLPAARWKYRMQKWHKKSPSAHHPTTLSGNIFSAKARINNRKNLLSSNISPICPHNMTNFGPLAAEICWRVWGTPTNFNGFRVLAALLHGIPVLGGINQTLRRWTQGATYIQQGGYHVGHWPTFLVFVIFLHILAKIWLQWQRSLQPCNQKCLLCIGRPRKPPAISNEILFVSCRNAFVAILVPKLVAMVMPLCSVCTGVSQMSSPMAQTLSQNQTLHGYVAHSWSYGHFCDILHILAKIWSPWQRPFDPCKQKCLLRIGWTQKLPVISNHILVISGTNAFICIYTNFCPKIGRHGKALCS